LVTLAYFKGNKKNLQNLGVLLKKYNLYETKIAEFDELDKIIYYNLRRFVKMA